MSKQDKVKILLVDDHQIVIDGIKNLLRKSEEVWVVGECLNGRDALDFLANNKVDLLITDLQMPEMSGLELTQRVRENHPGLKVLVLSMHHEPEIVQQIFQAQAEGYILKNTDRRELKRAIFQVIEGGTFFSREVLQSMLGKLIPQSPAQGPEISLSPREKEVLQLVSEENTTAEIAEKLFISPRTVETHRKHILQKTGAKSVVGMIMYAIKNGLITPK